MMIIVFQLIPVHFAESVFQFKCPRHGVADRRFVGEYSGNDRTEVFAAMAFILFMGLFDEIFHTFFVQIVRKRAVFFGACGYFRGGDIHFPVAAVQRAGNLQPRVECFGAVMRKFFFAENLDVI